MSENTLTEKKSFSLPELSSRLDVIQNKINARNFVLYTISFVPDFPRRQQLICELNNYDSENSNIPNVLIETYGDEFLCHFNSGLLPIIWNNTQERTIVETSGQFYVRLDGNILPFSGIAFPVRLGFHKNGYIVFTAEYMMLANEIIIETHGACYQVIMDFLSLFKKRSTATRNLTERETSCLQLAGDGYTSEEIAEKLRLSVHTVNAYLGSATVKLDAVNRIQAIAKAIRLGYIC
ncbi:MAG: helix-turn-helix transcriptional regulator [Candidatus Liberibacter europaeus]|uniref:Helix-turn-helix transcriptional regulator n=1 Tax=Candidatus Liberibacter europaeus TaxID=744859 RepID=A0A2T4VXM2_9HYPH|nr:helix-turn-helix transcriptional regulator [Candidatus Liberibacter europaeus]PTL86524.1 MAG: helix-turn-helix transcriptional regulator [Candidatus Liberibacter europaeus]